MTQSIKDRLQCLIGEEMSGICFVRDYVEFHFDGTIFRSFESAFVRSPQGRCDDEDAAFSDLSRSLIGWSITSIDITDEQFVAYLGSEREIAISLVATESSDLEAAHIKLRNEPGILIW